MHYAYKLALLAHQDLPEREGAAVSQSLYLELKGTGSGCGTGK
ncbi:MAG: hypothetical protein OSB03_04905 [Vicinamibacterales bacterium]|nr:hypothetical protein [Vicinamibacterales bacterium]